MGCPVFVEVETMTGKPLVVLAATAVLAWLDARWLLGAVIVLNVAALLAMYWYIKYR